MKSSIFALVVLCSTVLSGHAMAQSDAKPRLDTSGVNMQPNYPDTALYSKESGAVAIRAYVRDDGTVSRVSLAHTSGYEDLDSAAANAVLHWKFFPAVSGGRPVSDQTTVMVQFQPPGTPQ